MSYRSSRAASSLKDARSTASSQSRRPPHYPLQYVDVVIPKFIKLVGNPKTKEVTLERIEKALEANRAKFHHDTLAEMFEEADVKNEGFLTPKYLMAAAIGRYYRSHKYTEADWANLIADVLNVPVNRLDPAMDLVVSKRLMQSITGDFELEAESTMGQLPSISSRDKQNTIRLSQSTSGMSIFDDSLPIIAASFQHTRQMQMTKNTEGDEKLVTMVSSAADMINGENKDFKLHFQDTAKYKDHSLAPITKQELDTSMNPQYQQYLAAVDKAYGTSAVKTWKARPKVVTHDGFENRVRASSYSKKRNTSLHEKWKPNSKPTTALAPLRTRTVAKSKETEKHFYRTDRLVTIHDYDYYKTLGDKMVLTPMGQTFPRRPEQTQIGLPQSDLYHISSAVQPPRTFGSAPWWN